MLVLLPGFFGGMAAFNLMVIPGRGFHVPPYA
jgi:hypothetical protein